MNYFSYFLFFILLASNNNIFCPCVKSGDIKNGFSFSLCPYLCVDYITKKEYVAAAESLINDRAKAFGVSVCEKNNNNFYPLLSSDAIVNNILIKNPLYNGDFYKLDLFFISGILGLTEQKNLPAVSINNDPRIFIIVKSSLYTNENNIIMSTDYLTDSQSDDAKIIDFATNTNGFTAAVCNKNKNFGDIGANTAIYSFSINENISKKNNGYGVGFSINQKSKKPYNETLASIQVGTSDTITFYPGGFSMFGDTVLNASYIGISGSGTTGIRAVTIGDQEVIYEGALDAAPLNNIIATQNINKNIFINKINILHSSTGLSYLVILGGEGNTKDDTNNSVYALPLVNLPSSKDFGKLAKINQSTQILFNSKYPMRYLGTFFLTPAEKPGELYKSDDIGAKVGRSPLLIDGGTDKFMFTINSIESFRDSIFALSTFNGDSNIGIGGIFYSQAIFDETGAINCWSPWLRKNVVGNYSSQKYIPELGAHIMIPNISNKTVIQTEWSKIGPWSQGLNNIYKDLPAFNSGIQKIVDISHFHNGLASSDPLNPILKPSFSFYLGYKTVIIQQTSTNSGLLPLKTNKSKIFKNGSMEGFNSTENISTIGFTGGQLDNSGAIITAAIGFIENTDCWLIVGGSNGVFILSKNNGCGCGTNLLRNNFEGLTSDMSWKKIGNFKNVKKIISQNNFLYIVSNDSIDQIKLYPENIIKGENIIIKNLAKASNFSSTEYPSFNDGLFSGNAWIIASNNGLYNYINNKWEKINLPGGSYAPLYLFPISANGNPDDWAKGKALDLNNRKQISGNIYLATTSIPTHQSEIYRLIVYGSDDGVTENTIQILNNFFLQNQPTYYINPGSELLSIIGDGAAWYTHSILSTGLVFRGYIGLLNPFLETGLTNQKMEINLVATNNELNEYIGPVCYSSGFGLWLSANKSGVYGIW
jgi:hypothetical protein